MPNKKKSVPNTLTLVIKGLAALLIGWLLIELVMVSVFMVSGVTESSTADYVSWCEDEYNSREFADLYETLTLFDLYGEEYAVYWEITDAYNLSQEFIQWDKAALLGIENAREEADTRMAQLEQLADNPQFPRNQMFLAELVHAAQTSATQTP